MNLTGQKTVIIGIGKDQTFLKKNFHKDKSRIHKTLISNYLNFNVTTANTTDKMVTTQKRTAILLSWYPSF